MTLRCAQFQDLPVELLPIIVQYVVKPSHLANLCLVNQSFYTFAIPLLYERVFIYAWHKEGKAKVCHAVLACVWGKASSCSIGYQTLQNIGRIPSPR